MTSDSTQAHVNGMRKWAMRSPMISGVATTRKNATCTHDTHASTPNDSSPRCVRGPGRDAAAGGRPSPPWRQASQNERAIMASNSTRKGMDPRFVSSNTKYSAKATVNERGMANSTCASS